MTNSAIMGEFLGRRCCGGHRHIQLKGGDRCARAAIYTPEFAEALVEGFKLHCLKTNRPPSKRTYSRKQEGSLKARDKIDASLNSLDINENDPEDCPTIEELSEMYALLPQSGDDTTPEKR